MAGDSGTDEFGGARATARGGRLDAELDRAVSSGEAPAYLVLIAGEQPGRVYPLSHNTTVIGRTDAVDVALADPSVSTRHAQIINGVRGFEIEDLQSTNGTMIGGRRIARSPLGNGDHVTVGRVELVFLLDRPTDFTLELPGRNLHATTTLVPTGTMQLRPSGSFRARSQSGPIPVSVAGRADDDGVSLFELLVRALRFVRFLRPNLPWISACLATFLALGLASMLVVPPRSSAACEIKLLPEVKTNPVTGQVHADDSSNQVFFQGPERAFVQPDLVRASLLKLEAPGQGQAQEPAETEVNSVALRLKLDPMGDHLYRAAFTDKVIDRGKPAPLAFLPLHINTFIKSEIDHALRAFNAQVAFLRDQVSAVDKDLARINEERTRFREANADKLPEDAVETHSSRFTLDSRRADLTAQVRRLQADLAAARLQVEAGRPGAQTRYQSAQTYRESLATVNRKLSEAYASGLADGHPEVQQQKAEKAHLEELIKSELQSRSEVDKKADPGLQAEQGHIETLEAQLAAARNDLADTDKSLVQVRALVGALPRVEQRLVEMTNQTEATTKLRGQLFEKLKQAELQLNLEQVSAQSRYDIGRVRLERPSLARTCAFRGALGLFVGLLAIAAWLLAGEGRRILNQALAKLDNGSRSTRAS